MVKLSKIFKPGAAGKVRWIIALIFFISILCAFFVFPGAYNSTKEKINELTGLSLPDYWEVPFSLGLDLQGGTHLIYQADLSQIEEKTRGEAMEGVRDVIERRVNAFGVAEPDIRIAGNKSDRLNVELAGVKDVTEAIKMIGETPILEFKEQDFTYKELAPEQQEEIYAYNADAFSRSEILLEKAKAGEDFEFLIKNFSEDEITRGNSGFLDNLNPTGEYMDLYFTLRDLEPDRLYDQVIKIPPRLYIAKMVEKSFAPEEKQYLEAHHILICHQESEGCDSVRTKEEALALADNLKNIATIENFITLAQENSDCPSAASGGYLGWFNRLMMVESFSSEAFKLEKGGISGVVETEFGYHIILATDKETAQYRAQVAVIKEMTPADILGPDQEWVNTGLSGKELNKAYLSQNPNTFEAEIILEFDEAGKKMFEEVTSRNIGKPVAIFLDGYPISMPTVQEAIRQGNARITGLDNMVEAKLLVQRLNAGALPVPIKIINQETIGASLGKDSVAKSLYAGIIGFLAVIVFMVVYYRVPGILASFALIMYTFIILTIFKIVPVTLTLSGIAGFLLSIGMAVDANILIFERMREELKNGKTIVSAIDEGFKRAWPSIRDGNVSTIITCLILIAFTSSMVRGFAITLFIGVLMSMFSAITISRNLLKFISPWIKNPWLFGVHRKKTQ